ncbi:RNA polymerase sigma factor [Pinibacter soli]|uniref:Sigma-70 family RNA polymerase sigma factor n=1 Tax=Pinibacter soli TaxID=3044211 RepID=A0ABT6R9J3_9BACT|nr:sigma-70 family RNA polymerase sigma factor [Pinibacter soli]MDI3319234.1 sigma-70 family RNA polymerase sigma factor [Pinibacter soli]
MELNDDARLINLLLQDDVEGFNVLYAKYHRLVYGNIMKLVKDTDSAKDILQEVFVTLWEKRHTIDATKSLSGWLFTVSYNKSIDFLKKALQTTTVQKELSTIMSSSGSDSAIKEKRLQLLEEAIKQLSPQKRKVFVLCKLQGKTYEESAKELNISKYTVKEYLSLAVAHVQKYMQAHLSILLIAAAWYKR